MALLRGKLLAGALCAGALFGTAEQAPEQAAVRPAGGGGFVALDGRSDPGHRVLRVSAHAAEQEQAQARATLAQILLAQRIEQEKCPARASLALAAGAKASAHTSAHTETARAVGRAPLDLVRLQTLDEELLLLL